MSMRLYARPTTNVLPSSSPSSPGAATIAQSRSARTCLRLPFVAPPRLRLDQYPIGREQQPKSAAAQDIFHQLNSSRPPTPSLGAFERPKPGGRDPAGATMSLVNLAHACSHLQNASKARLGLTSITNSNFHLKLMLALHNSGFISTVVRGGAHPPPPHKLLSHPSSNTEGYEVEAVTQRNIASRRLWLGLKYWNSEPVLESMQMVSKPTRRIWMDVEGLKRLVLGKPSGYVKGLTKPGECLYVCTDQGIFESRECVERKIGGMLLCRVA